MNTPVSFELAKLLKEKGFNKALPSICFIKEESNYTSTMVYEVLDMDFEYILRPTIAEVVMWLYEKHGIWVCVAEHDGWGYSIQNPYSETTNNVIKNCFEFDSPTEAYEAAIDYTLNNLI